jgi:cell division protein FtsQ
MSKKTSKLKSVRNVVIYIFALALLSGGAFIYSHLSAEVDRQLTRFQLKQIEISGNDILSKDDALKLCGFEKEQKLMTINVQKIVDRLKESPYIESATAIKSLPAKLRITINERKPIAFIYGRGLNLIDAKGTLMPIPKSNRRWNLPFITGVKERLGSLGKISEAPSVILGVKILAYINQLESVLSETVSEVDLSDKNMTMLKLIRGNAEVRINPKEYKTNIYVISQYMQRYMDWDHLTNINYFDVRFTNQVIIKSKNT